MPATCEVEGCDEPVFITSGSLRLCEDHGQTNKWNLVTEKATGTVRAEPRVVDGD